MGRQGYSGVTFDMFAQYLTTNSPVADPYMCLADFGSYLETKERIDKDYLDRETWNKKSLVNFAKAGYFSADRSIKEYAENIWYLKQVTSKTVSDK